ncbi:MAG: SPOR domain-containing protein [Treponema sp.]|nr:SPOR domain-containing protein [Treponema sp.]
MEKRKLLYVAISVGIFLVIAIVAAIVFAPKTAAVSPGTVTRTNSPTNITVPAPPSYPPPFTGASTGEAAAARPGSVDPVDLVRKPNAVPGLQPPPEGTSRQGDGFYVSGQSGAGTSSGRVISVPKPSTAAVPDTPPANQASAAVSPAPPPPKPAVTQPAAQAKPRSKTPARTRIYDDYWVQTGAFSTVAKAEGVKETLATKGITSIIENRDVDGKTLFRVRVGPYTSKNEADYWLSLIQSLGGFENSQVRQTRTQR